MSVKLEVRETWLMDCLIQQLPITRVLYELRHAQRFQDSRRKLDADLAQAIQEILDKAAMAIQDIENEWHRRQGG